MIFNKNRIVSIFTALGIQIAGGIGLANAVCENEIDNFCRSAEIRAREGMHDWDWAIPNSKCKAFYKEELDKPNSMSVQEIKNAIDYDLTYTTGQFANDKSTPILQRHVDLCIHRAQLAYLTNKSSQPTGGGNIRQDSANSQSNSGASNQSSSSQSAPPSENNQTNTSQQTTTSKKGKKNPNDVPAKCVKFNHDKTKIVNMCNFPINFSFCMMHQDDQSIQVANSCNDGFVAETVYPGRAISDESLDTRFFAVACKFPSKPINVRYISFSEPLEGNCPR